MKKAVITDKVALSLDQLSPAIEIDGFVFTSGVIHIDKDFQLVGQTMQEKATKVMENLKAILEEAGLTFDNVIKVVVYLTNMDEYKQFSEVYAKYFSKPMPAREIICIKSLPLEASVEVSLVAKK